MKNLTVGSVAQLYRYPVKSMRGVVCQTLGLYQGGVTGDRIIALQDVRSRKLVTAKQPSLWKAMLMLETQQNEDGTTRVIFPTGQQISLTDSHAATMLSDYLGRSVTILFSRPELVEMERADPDEIVKKGADSIVNFETMAVGAGAPKGGFVDYGPVHLISTSSLNDVGHHSVADKSEPERFRANVIIDSGELAPFCENEWIGGTMHIGDQVRLHIVLATPRCAVPTLRQTTLESDTTFLARLKQANIQPFLEGKKLPSLGVYAEVVSSGEIRLGDSVTFTDT